MPKRNPGAHIKYRKDRNCWEVIEFVDGKRKRLATGIRSRNDAEAELAKILVLRVDPRKNERDITLGELIAYYVREHVPTLNNATTAIKCMERIIPFWGNLKLDSIKKSKSLEYMEYRKGEFKKWQKQYSYKGLRELSPETVRREIEQLQAVVSYAYRDNIIGVCPYIWKPSKSKPRSRWLTRNEAASLIRAARNNEKTRDYLPIFIIIGLYTGARSAAILNLRWHHVDFKNNLIDFTKGYDSKTKQGAIVPIPKKLAQVLRSQKKYGTNIGYVVHINQMKIKSVKRGFATACKNAGLEDVTPHTLRHTCASWLVQKGVPTAKVAKYLGHTSPQMIEKTYGHLNPSHLSEIIEALG